MTMTMTTTDIALTLLAALALVQWTYIVRYYVRLWRS